MRCQKTITCMFHTTVTVSKVKIVYISPLLKSHQWLSSNYKAESMILNRTHRMGQASRTIAQWHGTCLASVGFWGFFFFFFHYYCCYCCCFVLGGGQSVQSHFVLHSSWTLYQLLITVVHTISANSPIASSSFCMHLSQKFKSSKT